VTAAALTRDNHVFLLHHVAKHFPLSRGQRVVREAEVARDGQKTTRFVHSQKLQLLNNCSCIIWRVKRTVANTAYQYRSVYSQVMAFCFVRLNHNAQKTDVRVSFNP